MNSNCGHVYQLVIIYPLCTALLSKKGHLLSYIKEYYACWLSKRNPYKPFDTQSFDALVFIKYGRKPKRLSHLQQCGNYKCHLLYFPQSAVYLWVSYGYERLCA